MKESEIRLVKLKARKKEENRLHYQKYGEKIRAARRERWRMDELRRLGLDGLEVSDET